MSPLNRTAVALLLVTLLAAASPAAAQYLSIVPQPPPDLASRNASLEDLAKFAWQEFLADFGNNKPSIAPPTIHYVAPQPNTPNVKLKHYLDLVKTLQPQP